MNTILQVPVNKNLRDKASKATEKLGFSSLQEAVRLFLNKLADGDIDVVFEETVQLSPKAIRRYNKMIDEIESGRVKLKPFSNVKSLMRDLNGN